MKKVIIIFFATSLFYNNILCQEKEIDSLILSIKTEIQDTNKLYSIIELISIYETQGRYIEGIYEGEKGIIIANKSIASTNNIKEKETFIYLKGLIYINTGVIHFDLGNYSEALANYIDALKLFERINAKRSMSLAYNNIGNVYNELANYDEALKNHMLSLELKKQLNLKYDIAYAYTNIGNIYINQKKYEEAIKSIKESIKIKQELGNKLSLSISYNSLAIVYSILTDYEQALKYNSISLNLKNEIGDTIGKTANYINIANIYTNLKKFNLAREYFKKAKDIAHKYQRKDNLYNIYSGLTRLDSATNNYKSAYLNYVKSITYRDSLNNEENQKKILQTQMTYDFDKKQAIIDTEHKLELDNQKILADERSKKQKIIILFILIGLIVLTIFFIIIFRSLKITKKQNILIEQQKQIVEEKQNALLDSMNYAKRIQHTLLASDELLKENLSDYFILFKPKDIVSGDFYWAETKNNGFYLALCDSTGHGVPGAFMSLLNSSFLNEALNEKNISSPNEIFNYVRKRLIESISRDGAQDGMDAALFCFEKSKKRAVYAAAHNVPILVRNNELILLPSDKMPVGKGELTASFNLYTIDLKDGDIIYLFTDGYVDQFGGEKGKKLKHKKFQEKIIEIQQQPMNIQKTLLEKMFEEWKGNYEQIDDVSIIGVKV